MLGEALDEIAALLTAAGVRTAIDVADVNTPGALLVADEFDPDALCGPLSGILRLDVWLIVPGTGRKAAHAALADLLRLALTVIQPTGPIEVVDLPVPDGGQPRPAYRIPTQVHIHEEPTP